MVETHTEVIKRLIATYTKKRDASMADLRALETGDMRIGAAELGTKDGDISQYLIRQQTIWIAELESLLADLNGLLLGTRTSV